ncbi:MAG: N-6 DNA methylase [Candidatus Pacebacteria bacterium]|nr:N-6 DNA methylase [Candidatus Paceibacterota bacterium]
MLNSATKRKIDNARDILVGKIPMPTTQVEQITLALIYKFMSDIDKKSKALGDTSGFFANGFEKYAWDNLMDKSLSARDRVQLYSEGLEKMSKNPHLPQLFRDIFKNAFLPFRSPETLKLFLEQIDEFEYDHSEELGNAFEYLLSVMGSQGDAGQFRTPRHIIDFIVKVVDPSKTDSILDPACGTAGFLISAYKHIKEKDLTAEEQKKLTDNFVGYDISQDMQRLAMVNMYLHHFPNPHVFEYDTLSSEDRWDDDFDVILANPPFMTPTGGIKPHSKFSVQTTRAEALFTSYIMDHLNENGKAGVIVPEGIIFKSDNAYKSLRKMMIDNKYLWAVVSLPAGVFNPYSGVKTSILFLDKKISKKTDKVLLIKINNDGFDLGAQRRLIKKNDLIEAINIIKKYKKGLNNGEDTNLNDNQLALLVDKKEFKEKDYSLSSELYEAEVSDRFSKFDFVEINSHINTISPPKKIKKTDFLQRGLYPIIDQSQNDIAGFTNDSTALLEVSSPLVIFGDHTCIVKYIENSFAQGADGIKIISSSENLLPKYLYYVLKYKPLKSNGYQRHFSKLKRYKIPLPSLLIQQEIIEEFDSYQKIIDGAKQVVNNYQPTFGIENDWKLVKFSEAPLDIIDGDRGVNYPKKTEFTNDGYCLFLNTKNVRSDGFLFDNLEFINRERDEKLRKGKLNRNDVVITTRGTIGNVGWYSYEVPYKHIRINSGMIILRTDAKELNPEYLFYFLQSEFFKKQVDKMSSGAAQPQLPIRTLKEIIVAMPSLSTQSKVVEDIKSDSSLVKSTQLLIEKFEYKIKLRIDEIWGK